MIVNWFGSGGRSVLVVRYEDLERDSLTEVKRILDFLKIEYCSQILFEGWF